MNVAPAIPRVIHQIWLGPPMPRRLRRWVDGWKHHHPGWVHRLWTEADLPELHNADLYERALEIAPHNIGQFRSDVVRYELLHRYGGVYLDTDFECRRPIDALLRGVELCAAWEVDERHVANGLLGAQPADPFLGALIEGLAANVERHRGARPNRMTGPGYLTAQIRRLRPTITLFPSRLFIPYAWNELDRGGEDFPEAYAVHWWANARTNPHPAGRPRS